METVVVAGIDWGKLQPWTGSAGVEMISFSPDEQLDGAVTLPSNSTTRTVTFIDPPPKEDLSCPIISVDAHVLPSGSSA